MFSNALVKFTGIFLILYISATSATPAGKAQNIKDNIRARDPDDHYQCQYSYGWSRRECVGSRGPQAWHDVCERTVNLHTHFVTATEYDNKPGSCPDDTYCLDGFNNDNRRFISCISDDKGGGKQRFDPQSGTSDPKRARTQLTNTQFECSVIIDHDMTGAAVAAVLKSDDGSFLIAPNNVIVGNVHGKVEPVCHGDKSSDTKARECYPNGTFDFKAGQTIDFTWGMVNDQEGKLLYSIMPAQSVE